MLDRLGGTARFMTPLRLGVALLAWLWVGPASSGGAGGASASAAPAGTTKPDRPRVGVVRLKFTGNVVEAARELFAQKLAEGLAVADFEVTSGAAVAAQLKAAGLDPHGCTDEDCYRRAAPALGVAYLVAGSVGELQKTYEISLAIVNGRTGAVIGTHRERCEICGVEEAGEKMGLAASALRARLEAMAKVPARFVIKSKPAGAVVAMDGQTIGRTPIDREIAAGAHTLQITAEGYDPMERTLTVVSGVDETLDLYLQPLPSKFPFAKAGWGAIAAGAVALGAGIYAMSKDGDELACSAAEKDPWGHCPHLRNTRELAAGLVGLGVGAATLGGVWLYLGQGRGPRPEGAGTPAAMVVGVNGRF